MFSTLTLLRAPYKLLICYLIIKLFPTVSYGSKGCQKNPTLGDVEGNTYFCDDLRLTECCEQEKQFTCCESQTSKSVKEQLILWGLFASVALCIGVLFYCARSDQTCCNDNDTFSDSLRGLFCCKCFHFGRKRKTTSHDVRDMDSVRNSNPFITTIPPYTRLPPLPPETPNFYNKPQPTEMENRF